MNIHTWTCIVYISVGTYRHLSKSYTDFMGFSFFPFWIWNTKNTQHTTHTYTWKEREKEIINRKTKKYSFQFVVIMNNFNKVIKFNLPWMKWFYQLHLKMFRFIFSLLLNRWSFSLFWQVFLLLWIAWIVMD